MELSCYTHSVGKIIIEQEQVKFIPLDYDWLKEELKKGKIKLPYVTLQEYYGDILIFLATSSEWMAFLRQHKDNNEAFSLDCKFVLKK